MTNINFSFTPDNLIDNLYKLGGWSTYGLASCALEYYFPKKNKNEYRSTVQEIKILEKMGLKYWQDVIIKYHKEVGYKANELSNTDYVNAY